MSLTLDEIHAEALGLPEEPRAELVERLMLTLVESPGPEVEQAWFQEAERRRQQLLDGSVQGVPAEEVFARLSAKFQVSAMRVRFHPVAELELSEAADFYDRENEGLGARLIAKVRIATDLACRYPKMAP